MKMNKLTSIGLVSAFVLSASAASAETITFGGSDVWDDYGLTDGTASPFTVSLTQDGLKFDLTFTSSNAFNTRVDDTILTSSNSGDNTWSAGDGDITIALVVTELTSTLDSISLNSLSVAALNGDAEDVLFTDFNSNTVTGTGANATTSELDGPDFSAAELFGATGGLTPLSIANIGSWTLNINPTAGASSGIGNVKFDYTYTVPEPGTYALLAGCAALGFVMLRRRK